MEYTDEQLKTVIACGILGYPPGKIINILDIEDEDAFLTDFNDTDSKLYKKYQKGVDKAKFELDYKLYELAKSGDMEAMNIIHDQRYEQRILNERQNTENGILNE